MINHAIFFLINYAIFGEFFWRIEMQSDQEMINYANFGEFLENGEGTLGHHFNPHVIYSKPK